MAGIVPNYNPTSVNFAGSNSALNTAERGFANAGSLADQILDRYNKEKMQAEQIRQFDLANQRANEQLGLEKQKYADVVDARVQGNAYANALRNAVAPGVIGQQDQAAVGQKIADLGTRAQAAYASGDTRTGDRLVAEQQGFLGANVPRMADKFQTNGQGKIDVLRGVTSGPMVDAQTQAQLYGVIANPIQNDINQQQQHGFRIEEIGEEAKLRRQSDAARIAAETRALLDRTLFMDPKTNQYVYGEQLKGMPQEARGNFVPEQVVKNALEANKQKLDEQKSLTWAVWDPQRQGYMQVPEGTPGALRLAVSSLHSGGGFGGGRSGGGDGKDISDANKLLENISSSMWSLGTKKDAVERMNESRGTMNELGVPNKIQEHILATALEAGAKDSKFFGKSGFDSDLFKQAVATQMNTYASGGFAGQGYGSVPNKEKLSAWLAKQKDNGIDATKTVTNKDTGVQVKGSADDSVAALKNAINSLTTEDKQQLLADKEKDLMELFRKARTTPSSTGDTAWEPAYQDVLRQIDLLKGSLINPNTITPY